MTIRNLFGFNKRKNTENIYENSLIPTLMQIKEGNKRLRNDFISTYKPFILKVTSKTAGKFIDPENSDEYSVGMSAFNEAIDKFDTNKNANFFLFAQKAIERRVIDYLRKNKRNKEYPFTYFSEEDDFNFEEKYFLSDSNIQFEDIEVRDEIDEFKKELKEYDITLRDLLLSTPKHKDSRDLCFKIASILAEDELMFNSLSKHKIIPRNELVKKIKVHERTIGNNRKYIIGVCLILRSNLEISKSYLKYAEKEGR